MPARKKLAAPKISLILVERLCDLYWFKGSSVLWRELTVEKLLQHDPIDQYIDEKLRVYREDVSGYRELEGTLPLPEGFEGLDDDWHIGRARFFYDQLLAGDTLDPISLDNVCNGSHIYAMPVVIDGHHRLGASLLAGVPTIPAYYGGRTDLLSYLTGRRKTCPID